MDFFTGAVNHVVVQADEASEAASTHDTYTHGHHASVLRSHSWRTAANSAAYLLPHLEAGMSLLDVGCGPGTLTADLAARVAPGRVVGVDASADVVERARSHARERGGEDGGPVNLHLVAGDFRDLDLAADGVDGGWFDVVHAHQVLQHLQDPVDALRAMAALVRPGGLVAVRDGDYASMTWYPADERLDRWLQLMRDVTRRNGGEPDSGRHLLAWAHAAGLHDVTCTTSTWTFVSPEDRAWWGDSWAERTVTSAVADQAQSYGLATTSELADMAEGWRAWTAHPDALFAVLHGEILATVP